MECTVVKLVYKFDEKSTASVQKVSRLLKYDSNFFWSTNIYYGHQHQSIYPARAACVGLHTIKKTIATTKVTIDI